MIPSDDGATLRRPPHTSVVLGSQCGFASTEKGNLLTEEQQWAKLRLCVEVAQDVWGGV